MPVITKDRGFCSTRGIGFQKGLFPHDFDLTDKCRDWLNEHTQGWRWDHIVEYNEIEFHFKNTDDQLLFKLTWC